MLPRCVAHVLGAVRGLPVARTARGPLRRRWTAGAGLALAIFVAASPAARADAPGFDPAAVYRVPTGASPVTGAPDGAVTIVEWSDYACGFCNRVQPVLAQLDALFPGELRWVHRTLPLDEDDTLAAEAGLAARAQGRFEAMHRRLFALAGRVDRPAVELLARELGLDMVRFRADLDTGAHRAAISADAADARALGITGTPMFFVDGRPIHGSQPLKVFVDVVLEERARAAAAGAAAARPGAAAGAYEGLVAGGRPAADGLPEAGPAPFALDPARPYQVGLGLPGHQRGPDAAELTIVTWSDFECPFCARMAPVLAAVQAAYGDRVRVVYRHLPMAGHPHAALAAEAAVAAAEQGRFWQFHDALWAMGDVPERAVLERAAAIADLDLARFAAALDDRRFRPAVAAEAAAAAALGVSATPTLFINGRPIVGARDEAALRLVLDAHLGQVRQVVAAGVQPRDLYALIMSMAEGRDLADPAAVPLVADAGGLELGADDQARATLAACRLGDGGRAAHLARRLAGLARARVAGACAELGIDLPPAR